MLSITLFATFFVFSTALYPLPTSIDTAPFLDLPSSPYPAPKAVPQPAVVYGPPVVVKHVAPPKPIVSSYVYEIPKQAPAPKPVPQSPYPAPAPPPKPSPVYGPPKVVEKVAPKPVVSVYKYEIPAQTPAPQPPPVPAVVYGPPKVYVAEPHATYGVPH